MLITDINDALWSVSSIIHFENEKEETKIHNIVPSKLNRSEVIDYILMTRGDFLQLATVTRMGTKE